MIYTVTLNPSLDYCLQLKRFCPGTVNRTEKEAVYPGGKGINVSIVLKNLGFPSKLLGFCAGFTGSEICRLLQQYGCSCSFIQAKNGFSRINVKIKEDEESELNGSGPVLTQEEVSQLFCQLSQLQAGDILVLAGSIPASLSQDIYEKILKQLSNKSILFVVDTYGELLSRTLFYRPFLIKPNHHELGALFHTEITSCQEAVSYAKKLQRDGARNVLVSLAQQGAVFIGENGEIWKSAAPHGGLINSVGAGDSMVAGFLAGYLKYKNYKEALRLGVAAGSATAFSEWLAPHAKIEALFAQIDVQAFL